MIDTKELDLADVKNMPVDEELSAKLKEKYKKEATPQKDAFLIEAFQLFRQEFSSEADLVYYPCCGYDVSPSGGFPESRVIYLDKDHDAVKTLIGSGYEAVQGNAEEHELDTKADVVFLHEPVIAPDGPANQVAEGGYLICGDYFDSAQLLCENEKFELIGQISNEDYQPVLKDDAGEYLDLPRGERNMDDLFVFRRKK